AKIGAGHPVTGSPQSRSEETVAGPQVTHARHQDNQQAVAGEVVADPSLGAAEIAGFLDGRHGTGLADACRLVRRAAHAFIAFGLSARLRHQARSSRPAAQSGHPSPGDLFAADPRSTRRSAMARASMAEAHATLDT